MVDAKRNVHLFFQMQKRLFCRLKWVCNANSREIFLPLPHIHIVCHNTDNPDPKSVSKRVDHIRMACSSCLIYNILADTRAVMSLYVSVLIVHPIIKIMVAERIIIVAAVVHDIRNGLRRS